MFSMQCRKIITVEDNKKRMNITDFINIYTNIYTHIIINYQEHVHIRWTSDVAVKKKALVNDGDIKKMTNNF